MMANMKSYLRIGIIIGIVVIAAAGVWYWQKSKTASEQLGTPAVSLVPLASVSPLAVSYDLVPADWKTYASPSAGFKVAYPADWTPSACGAGCVAWAPAGAPATQFALGIVRSDSTIEELLKSAAPFLAGKEEITVGANKWLKLTLQQPTTGDVYTSHFIMHNGKLFEFGMATTDKDVLAVYGKMIKSFVFTK